MLNTTTENNFVILSETYQDMESYINQLSGICGGSSKAAGWWDKPRNVGEALMLITSELAEAAEDSPQYNMAIMEIVKVIAKAMEGHRKSKQDEKIPAFLAIEAELADALIRIFDLAAGLNLRLGAAFAHKLHFNQTREDHKPENRAKPGGKAY